ncbi:hypothetical protein ABIB62_000131 [Mucilaginibacter sp. UYP25]|uniref:hypothetical protein n=1 Tax=unclassified Mucilaginibacter TaxID=2617802 RepID=UPI0033971AE2
MNTPDSPTPDPKVNAAEQDVITNKDDTEKATNNDGAVADMDGITETLSESEPATDLNADNQITNNDSAGTDQVEQDEQF